MEEAARRGLGLFGLVMGGGFVGLASCIRRVSGFKVLFCGFLGFRFLGGEIG